MGQLSCFPQCRKPWLLHGMNLASELHQPGQFPGAMSTPSFLRHLGQFWVTEVRRPHNT